MSRQEDLIEANKRGLLTGQTKIDFDLAVERGIIKISDGAQPQQPVPGGQPQQAGPGVPTETPEAQLETPVSSFGPQDYQSMTKSIIDQYNGGEFSPEKIKVFDELKKRGAFDAPEFNTKKGVAGYVWETISNVPGSAAGVAGDVWEAVTHPVETVKGMGKLAIGFGQKVADAAMPGEQNFEYAKLVDNFIDDMDRKYGSIEGWAETIKTDPVRVVGDIAASFSGVGGSLMKGTKIGKTLKAAGGYLEPLTPIAKGIKKVGEKIPQYLTFSKTPSKMYQSAVKFSTTLDERKRTKLTQTALDNDITPNIEGLDKLWDKINGLNSKITEMVQKAEDTGVKMPIDGLFKEFDKITADALLSSKPLEKMAAIENIRHQITKANGDIGRGSFSAKEAQQFKKTVYKDIQEYYEKNLKLPDSVKAQKSVARMSKDFLETVVPGIKEMNKSDGDYIALMKALDRPVSRIANHHIIGLGMTTKIATGTAIGGFVGAPVAGAVVGGMVGLLDHPQIKSNLAIVLNKMERQGIDPGPNARAFMTVLEESREIPRGEDEE